MSTPGAFTHGGPGTPAAAWRAHPAWASAVPLTLEGIARLVVVAAHPDDESLGAGGLVASARSRGVPVEVVCASDGEGSHPLSPTTTPERLAQLRAVEAEVAAAALGVVVPDHLHRLRLPDGDLVGHEDRVVEVLVELVGDGRDCVLVAPWRSDGHPDHEAAGRAAATAARRTGADLWEYPVWFWHWARPEDAPWPRLRPFALDVAASGARTRAVSAHATQVAPLSGLEGDEALLGADLLDHFTGDTEHFVRTASVDCPDAALEELHQQVEDPWGVESRWYEQRKRDLVLAALPRPRFARTLEIGCSTGALAEALAERSDRVLAVDRSRTALTAARRRFRDQPSVEVADLDVPTQWPEDTVLDLVVVSEVGYFLSPAALDELARRVGESLTPDGVLVLCHWRHEVRGWVMDAEEVHARVAAGPVPPLQATYRDRDVEIRVHASDACWPDPAR